MHRTNTADVFDIVDTIVDGRYRVQRVAGEGGFGVVYLAFHLGFESPIALKVLKLPAHWSPEKTRARIAAFQREGKVLFELSSLHPSILRAFETGTIALADGSLAPYLALEWLEGVSLARESSFRREHRLKPLPLEDVLAILHGPASALGLAHDRGVVHRDIKPHNLFVSDGHLERVVKILDFGVAKIIEEALDSTLDLGVGVGVTSSFTPMYAAPEQWLRRLGATGRATDVHAFALVCVELLTGCLPFRGKDSAQLMAACLDVEARPTPKRFGLSLPKKVEDVFVQAVALDPRHRFPDMRAFWSALCRAAEWSPGQREVELQSLAQIAVVPARLELDSRSDSTDRARRPTAPTAEKSVSRSAAAALRKTPKWPRSTVIGAALMTLGLALHGSSSESSRALGDLLRAAPSARHETLHANPPSPAKWERAESPVEIASSVVAPDFSETTARLHRDPTAREGRAKSPPPPLGATSLKLAEDLLSSGQIAEACARAETVVARAPACATCLEFLGRCYMRLGQKERAFSHYRRYLALNPDARDAVFIRAMIELDRK